MPDRPVGKSTHAIKILSVIVLTGIHFFAAGAIITSNAVTGNWNVGASWVGGVVPAPGDDVIIVSGAQIILTTNQTCNSLIINGTGFLNMSTNLRTLAITTTLTLNGTSAIRGIGATRTVSVGTTFSVPAAQNASIEDIAFTVAGATTINGTLTFTTGNTASKTFGSVTISGTGSWVNTSQNVPVSIGGDLSVAAGGIFSQGTGRVTFNRATSNTVTNTGTIAFGGGITVNKGVSQANVIDFQGPITMSAGGLTLTNGTFRLSSASTITAFTADPNFGATARLWCDGGTILAPNTPVSFSGTVQVSAGTLNVGTTVNNFLFANGGTLLISGGTVTVAGSVTDSPFATGAGMTFNMSGGTCTAGTAGSTNDWPFYIDDGVALGSNFTMTAGTLIIQNPGTFGGVSSRGYANFAPSTFTGGTLQIGNASSAVGSTIDIETDVPIFNLSANHTTGIARVASQGITVSNDLTISSGILNVNNFDISVGRNWTNNGAFINYYGTVTFNGTTTQTIGGTSSTAFDNMTLSGTGNTVSFSVATVIEGILTQNTGVVINPNSLTHTARTYIRGGTPQAPGSFGSTSSGAANQSNTFFTAGTTGILNVSNRIYYTRQIGNWNSAASWSTVTYGNATNVGTFPLAGDDANIGGGVTITVTAAAACATLFYQSAASSNSVSLNAGITLAVSRPITLARPTTAGFTNTLAVGAGTLTAGSIRFENNGVVNPRHSLTISTGTATISRDVITDGANLSPTVTFSGSGTLNVAGSFLNSTNCTFTGGTGTVNYNGTTVSQIIGNLPYYNLTLNNTFSTIPQLSLRANTTATNRLTMTSGIVNMRGFTFTLSSNASGALSHSLLSTSGWMYEGTIARAIPATAIGLINVNGFFPLGTSTDFRPFFVGKNPNPNSAGNIRVSHTGSSGSSVVSITDGAFTIIRRSNSFWTMSTSGSTAGATYGIRYGGTGLGTVTSLAHLRSCLAGTAIATHGAAVTNSLTDPRVERSALTHANLTNSFYVGSTDLASPLPIELINFNAALKPNGVELNWSTASELNNDFFTVERSESGEKFEGLMDVDGGGTTVLTSYYQAFDEAPLLGKSYYRLKQTDFDGKYSYSDVKVIENSSPTSQLKIYPNPIVEDQFTLEMNGLPGNVEVPLSIVNMQGATMYQATYQSSDAGNLKTTVELASLPSGIYLVVINAAIGMRKKIVILK